jgi:hypothetical protein
MMRHSHISHAYPASHYDDHLCLKPPLLLWVAALYLSRAVTLPIAMAIAHFAGVDQKAITLTRALWSVDGLVPSLIAAAVLYALGAWQDIPGHRLDHGYRADSNGARSSGGYQRSVAMVGGGCIGRPVLSRVCTCRTPGSTCVV